MPNRSRQPAHANLLAPTSSCQPAHANPLMPTSSRPFALRNEHSQKKKDGNKCCKGYQGKLYPHPKKDNFESCGPMLSGADPHLDDTSFVEVLDGQLAQARAIGPVTVRGEHGEKSRGFWGPSPISIRSTCGLPGSQRWSRFLKALEHQNKISSKSVTRIERQEGRMSWR